MKSKIFSYNQKRSLLLIFLAVFMIACTPDSDISFKSNGVLSGEFSISDSTKVHFSMGNLQYQPSSGKWRFAAKQYDIIGDGNQNISSSSKQWIDLFGWGTGNNPTLVSTNDSDYMDFIDWGINAISNGGQKANLWRTLTKDEWVYLFHDRPNAAFLFGMGFVNGVPGTILLPDNWTEEKFTDTENGLEYQDHYYFNKNGTNYSFHTYTSEQWKSMEQNGAVFLPVAGMRWGNDFANDMQIGCYWSASYLPNKHKSWHLYFNPERLAPRAYQIPSMGFSVRLVRNIN